MHSCPLLCSSLLLFLSEDISLHYVQPPTSRASHSNPTLPHPILIFRLVWSPSPYFSRPPGLYSSHWRVYMLAVCLCPMIFSRHWINNIIICLLKHIHSLPIINIIKRVSIITPNCTDCMCAWDTRHVPLSAATCSPH
jgi:hypothetical protein